MATLLRNVAIHDGFAAVGAGGVYGVVAHELYAFGEDIVDAGAGVHARLIRYVLSDFCDDY